MFLDIRTLKPRWNLNTAKLERIVVMGLLISTGNYRFINQRIIPQRLSQNRLVASLEPTRVPEGRLPRLMCAPRITGYTNLRKKFNFPISADANLSQARCYGISDKTLSFVGD